MQCFISWLPSNLVHRTRGKLETEFCPGKGSWRGWAESCTVCYNGEEASVLLRLSARQVSHMEGREQKACVLQVISKSAPCSQEGQVSILSASVTSACWGEITHCLCLSGIFLSKGGGGT